MKRPIRSRRPLQWNSVESLETRALLTMASTAPLPDVNFTAGAEVTPVNLDSYFKDPDAKSNFAIFDTTLGTIPVLLTPATTPKTVANFQNYANKGEYNNSIVHRSVPGFIWQGGGYQLSSKPSLTAIPADPPVQNEFGASNTRGTIAMAKLGSDPNSATSQFFFNESNNNASNLDNQNGGFTVFGNVVGDAGLAVMDAIAAVPVPSPGPLGSPLDQIPLQNYTPGTTVQPSNLVTIKTVTTANELFLASSDTPGVATASIQGSTLTVTPLAPGTAHITVVGYGSDGKRVSESFAVNISSTAQLAPPTTTTPQPVAPNPSDLVPSAKGPLPSSVVAGQRARIQQVVSLTAASSAVSQKERVTLSLSKTSTGSAGDFTIASASAKVRVMAGKQTKLKLSVKQVNASVPAGTYHLLVSVTDPDGSTTTVDTGKTLTVVAAQSKPSTRR
ncbi:Peptidyl-prolyl cis-trans isomerase (rotamase)-cyclophilin family [Singulisphaera sp. GP187]|uniref:peptidylprolyl isomerase n=1 Tax=Singulisphaera sp. GP187 TaxID=1882752 RepID=UPI0009271D73|nr:peptidylprolyl isomerase [Singulisphaera sp. GP187]SIN74135.1 Peptidyl-prolyl cis-trans isomerase (rotamase)-cyclophilin family [Singulisphaera sp. GP187]